MISTETRDELVGDLDGLTTAEIAARARDAWRLSGGTLTGAELARMFGRRERWGRKQIAAARADHQAAQAARTEADETAQGGTPDDTATVPPAQPEPDRRNGRHGRRRRARAAKTTGRTSAPQRHARQWPERVALTLTGLALAVVVGAPLAMSFHSLADWGRDSLGLADPLCYLVPLTLDAAGMVCVGLTFHAMLRADGAGAARLLVWVFTAASAWANWRHGREVSPDAALYYPAMPVVAALLLDITLRRIRRSALDRLGGLERPLPRYRAARWIVAPRETWQAWCIAVRDGITDPDQAVALARNGHPKPDDDQPAEPGDLAALVHRALADTDDQINPTGRLADIHARIGPPASLTAPAGNGRPDPHSTASSTSAAE